MEFFIEPTKNNEEKGGRRSIEKKICRESLQQNISKRPVKNLLRAGVAVKNYNPHTHTDRQTITSKVARLATSYFFS